VDLNSGAIPLGNFAIPATGGWQTWTTVTRTVTLNAGTYSLGVFAQTAGWNFNWIEVVSGGTGPTPVFSDEFNSINTGTWSHETGGGGFGNNEREYYTNGQNAFIQFDSQANSNVLVLEARRDNPANYNCWYGRCEYTSSRMNTAGKRTFQYGRIEARLKLPQTPGIWPAFWLLGNDIGTAGWPGCGELDIMEHVGFEPNITHGAMHGPNYSGNTPFAGTNYLNESVSANYHVYAIEWNSTSVRWFMDGNLFYTVNKSQVQSFGNWVFDHPMFVILNVAVGGNWPGNPTGSSVFPQRMYVDYIRVYQ
jgi:beta-glucanase (GH16 family)